MRKGTQNQAPLKAHLTSCLISWLLGILQKIGITLEVSLCVLYKLFTTSLLQGYHKNNLALFCFFCRGPFMIKDSDNLASPNQMSINQNTALSAKYSVSDKTSAGVPSLGVSFWCCHSFTYPFLSRTIPNHQTSWWSVLCWSSLILPVENTFKIFSTPPLPVSPLGESELFLCVTFLKS